MRIEKSLALIGALLAATALGGCGSTPRTERGVVESGATVSTLSGAQEVPPVDTRGSGRAQTWYSRPTRTLSWVVDVQGLSGPPTAAHFHGPAAPGQNAGVMIPISTASVPMTGAAMLTPAQEADLLAGRLYVNIHTAAHPNGEVRGQVAGPLYQ